MGDFVLAHWTAEKVNVLLSVQSRDLAVSVNYRAGECRALRVWSDILAAKVRGLWLDDLSEMHRHLRFSARPCQGESAAALVKLKESLAITEELGDRSGVARGKVSMAKVSGCNEEIFWSLLPAALTRSTILSVGALTQLSAIECRLQQIAIKMGDKAMAREELTAAIAIFKDLNEVRPLAPAEAMLASLDQEKAE